MNRLKHPLRMTRPRTGPSCLCLGAVVLALVALSACSDGSASSLEPEGAGARRIEALWWILFWLGVAVFITIGALIVVSWRIRRSDLAVNRFVIVGGVALPAIVLAVVGVETVRATSDVFEAHDEDNEAAVVVEGEQWWWRVTYPAAGVETANEVHIPVGEPVMVEMRSADVIHSFWVPEIAGKVDMIPGQTNHLVLEADRPGTYRGTCAEFCGLQHANMRFVVVAHEPDEFDAWLEDRTGLPATPAGLAAEGEEVFLEGACAGCHAVEGTPAESTVGPDLTDFGARRELGAGVVDNTPENLAQFVRNAPELKPGVLMPPIELTDEEAEALVAYLEGLEP